MTAAGTATPLPDREARRRATTEFERNLIVRAGAGTGKTSLLVERALNFLGLGIAPLSRIVAITFTEKAAGEMRGRLALGLDRLRALARGDEALGERRPSEADRAFEFLVEAGVEAGSIAARALAAMEELDQARVSTIHGLCSEILREFPVQAGIDPDFGVDSGEHAERFRRELWEAFLSRELGPAAPRAALWRELLARVPLGVVGEIALRLADFRIPDAVLQPPVRLPSPRELFAGEAEALAARVDSLLERQSGMTKKALSFFLGARDALRRLAREGIDGLHATLAGDDGLAGRLEKGALRANTRLEGVSKREFDEMFAEARGLLRKLAAADDELLTLVAEAAAPFALEFKEAFVRQGLLGFDGLLVLTRDLLRDHRDVRRELKGRWRMLLVDEFQDTDPVQYEIVLWLAERAGDDAGDAYRARLEPGRLFAVGDAKQSIYRFRGADYSAYDRAVTRVAEQGGACLELVANFRGHPGVVDPVNHLFDATGSCWSASDYQPDYLPVVAVEPERAGPDVELWSVDLAPRTRAADRRRAEGRLLAAEIERLVETDGDCTYRDVTILFRAFTHLSLYLRPLRERGIPFVVDGGREFLERPEVGQLMATLRALAQPSDSAALLAFLRSPAAGVPDTELAEFARAGGSWNWRDDADRRVAPRIADAYAMLRALERETRQLPADAVVRLVVERARLLPLGAAAYEGPQRVANLRKLSAAAGELARDGTLSLEQVVDAVQEGRLADIEMDRPLADDAAEAVRITSIHRMKGLENSRIFLPDLARKEARGSRGLYAAELLRAPDGRLCLALEAGGVPSSGHVLYATEDKRHSAAEETRVLYVGLTRARERLVVVAGPPDAKSPWVEALGAWGYDPASPPEDGALLLDGRVLHRAMQPAAARRARGKRKTAGAADAVRGWREALQAAQAAATPPFTSPSAAETNVRPPMGQGRLFDQAVAPTGHGRAIGVVLHRWLESWNDEPERELRDRLEALCATSAAELRVDAKTLLRETSEVLDAFLGSELARRFRKVERLGREVPLLMASEDGSAWRGSIDLLYRDSDGNTVVADYKTDAETDEAVLRERYGGQLAVYADAVRRALQLERSPGTELWLLRSGRRIEIAH